MYVSYDTEARATYVQVADVDVDVDRTVELSEVVMVDLDATGVPVGVEFLVLPGDVSDVMLRLVADRFPALSALQDRSTWLLPAS
jgi:uncharacterized protein YuzE